MAWTNIPDNVLEPGKPIRSVDAIALRDNPIALAQGLPGAPRVADAGLSETATNAGRDWVLNRTALAQVGAVGTYAFLGLRGGLQATQTPGATVAGSTLAYTNVASNSLVSSPIGTWRRMGGDGQLYAGGGNGASATLYLRIS